MARKRLDVAGQAKMTTLDEATLLLQRLHGLVEHYALATQRGQPASQIMMNLRRQLPALADMLKLQFGGISDVAIALNTKMTRGASEQARIRQMREGMATIRSLLEDAISQTVAKHLAKDEKAESADSSDRSDSPGSA